MAVKIRLARVGKKGVPISRIVAVDSRKKRDGEFIENLGTYNPLNHEVVQFHKDRIDYWLSQGAIATDTVKKIYKMQASKPAAK